MRNDDDTRENEPFEDSSRRGHDGWKSATKTLTSLSLSLSTSVTHRQSERAKVAGGLKVQLSRAITALHLVKGLLSEGVVQSCYSL